MQVTARRTLLTGRKSLGCRRQNQRRKVFPTAVTCWSGEFKPVRAAVIEADVRGARLSLSRIVSAGQSLKVSLMDRLGHYRTVNARVAWARTLEWNQGVVIGIAFEESLMKAA